jgi:sortase (surface protein transpeptidase)
MRLALGLAVIGVVLAVVATFGFLTSQSDTGDPGTVEASLTRVPSPSTSSPSLPPDPSPTTTTTSTDPLWVANESSLLAELPVSDVPDESAPERLIIHALGIDAPVGAYGVAANGQMDVPDNVTEVGWYRYGPSPGEPGSAVLAAHVDLRGPGRGLFYDLDQLEIDDEVGITYADGHSREFRVVARSTYLKTELPLDAIFSREGDPVLTLITCGGGFSRSAGSYDSNVIVYATPVEAVDVELPTSS